MRWMPLVPSEALILVIVFAGFGLILGLLSRRAAFGVVGAVVLTAMIRPFVPALLSTVPLWVLLPLVVVVGCRLFVWSAGFVLGKGAADHAIGTLVADAVKWFFGSLFGRR